MGKALDLRKATSSLCLNPSEMKKTAMNLINAVLISEGHNVLRVTVTGLSYPAISLTKLKCHPTSHLSQSMSTRVIQISPHTP